MQMDFGAQKNVVFEHKGMAGIIRLTRSRALNALSHEMINAIYKALKFWETDNNVHCIIVEGEGRAFCAGGDVVAVYKSQQETPADTYKYFRDEYRLNLLISQYKKPYISFWDGIIMGGGAGISVHGSHRIATEKCVFAMPETGIGLFPDVGGGYFLSRLPDNLGMYLGLTGSRLGWEDCLKTGLATHVIASENIAEVKQKLIETGEAEFVRTHIEPSGLEISQDRLQLIKDCFGASTYNGIIEKLEQAKAKDNQFASEILHILSSRSPTSLLVTFRQLTKAKTMSMPEVMRMEYGIVQQMLKAHDFMEGVRAVLIDKGDKPQWRPATLQEVSEADIDAYFPDIENEELRL